MSTSSSSLYGLPRPRKSNTKEISSSTSLAFTSQLSSLLSASSSSTSTTTGRPRPSTSKPSIFTAHNKGVQKRARADESSDPSDATAQRHKTHVEAVDAATRHRSKRKMEEKARLYAAMKRGDYVPPSGAGGVLGSRSGVDREENGLVDFDRKWAEREERKALEEDHRSSAEDNSDDDDDDDDDENDNENVEYEDEFGRLRTGTSADAARAKRLKDQLLHPSTSSIINSDLSARPAPPTNLIHGDTIQTAAFNPDQPLAAQIASLAAKRDRSATPPPDVHYDASKEIRSKGVGFYAFSGGKEEREGQMRDLEREREETERGRREVRERRERRKREVEERRRVIRERRGEREVDVFLEGLGPVDKEGVE
ncbi:MAG: hypothetical protein M1817_000009 [Caeruleum heppii]|nr:MAG: hypothetical protein M1817_000009 [Caeruleum heppii]